MVSRLVLAIAMAFGLVAIAFPAAGQDLSAGFQVYAHGAHLEADTPLRSGEEVQVRYIGSKPVEIACNTQISRFEGPNRDLGPGRVEMVAFAVPSKVGLAEYACQADGGEPFFWYATVSPRGEHAFEQAPRLARAMKFPRGQLSFAFLAGAKDSLEISNPLGFEIGGGYTLPFWSKKDAMVGLRLGAAFNMAWARLHVAPELVSVDDNVPEMTVQGLVRPVFVFAPARWVEFGIGPQAGARYVKRDFSLIRLVPGTDGRWLNDDETKSFVVGGFAAVMFMPTPGFGLGLAGQLTVNANGVEREPGNYALQNYVLAAGTFNLNYNFAAF